MAEKCPMCFDLGWVLDCNDLDKPGPRMAELMPCFYPPCEVSARPLASICFKGIRFGSVSWHPQANYVMSVNHPIAPGEEG